MTNTTNKFLTQLQSTHDSIKGKRAEVVARQAKSAQQAIVNKLQDEKDQLDLNLEKLYDLFPDSTVTLKIAENFDAQKWVEDVQNTKIAILNKEVELKAAKETYTEWFEEVPVNE